MADFFRTNYELISGSVKTTHPQIPALPIHACTHPADCCMLSFQGWALCVKCWCRANSEQKEDPPKRVYPPLSVIQVVPD